MAIFALSDLHLALNIPEKSMDYFGGAWTGYTKKIEEHWRSEVKPEDLVLIGGDISWAKDLKDALIDLAFIDSLPGTKVMIKGNHDYWWSSVSQVRKALPPSLHIIQNDTFKWNDAIIGGARLWDTHEFNFNGYVEYVDNPRVKKMDTQVDPEEQERIYLRELGRLEASLKALDKKAPIKIAMTHYPPIGPAMEDSRASLLLEKYGIQTCIFGHLHNLKKNIPLFGTKNGIRYIMTAGDYVDFHPVRIA